MKEQNEGQQMAATENLAIDGQEVGGTKPDSAGLEQALDERAEKEEQEIETTEIKPEA